MNKIDKKYNLDIELEALHAQLTARPQIEPYVTRLQVILIIIYMRSAMIARDDRDLRVATLRILVGNAMKQIANVAVKSTKNMTGTVASEFIEWVSEEACDEPKLSPYGEWLIQSAEERAKGLSVTA